ncbi:choice-of-anchor tandem repeat GloVer-containing protein [Adhaeribacter radiodurans]|uniref:T9SS type A sorting domain-containing protein n=1 Tax=Adhaeribacter radiodurans TaxID=2745197 RepID=A0A7L7LER9_9BACT|nr:choice-of-anchor tandem repeat GloVer-containing protein [Adhaeribacter radiodurans]QMU31362.1 T9SS type A sorting domain-containing protein [Adhaeribacter radiodurans]
MKPVLLIFPAAKITHSQKVNSHLKVSSTLSQNSNLAYFFICLVFTFFLLSTTLLFAQDELVGLTSSGGQEGAGTAFSIRSNGTNFKVQKNFAKSGYSPYGSLIKGPDGNFYGMTYQGGANNQGTIFKIAPSGTITTIINFISSVTGSNPQGSLTLGSDGNFYGMATYGGGTGYGTIFKITPTGNFTLLRNLNNAIDGRYPQGNLVQGSDGGFYGLTYQGGTNNYGTIFKITPSGTFTVLKQLDNTTTGRYPQGSLIRATDGNFYGMTYQGGENNYGTIFRITPSGIFTVRRHLDYSLSGANPRGSLIQGTNGVLYGMTYTGGANNYGTIFRMTLSGTFTVLRHLAYSSDGGNAQGSLTQGSDGNFYGLTSVGGTNSSGTVFKITPAGLYTVLHNLDNINDGRNPLGSLVQGSSGIFYGMTSSGGPGGYGTIFRTTAAGVFSVLVHFPESDNGHTPLGSLIQARNGNFYGITSVGGTYGYGTVFRFCDGASSTLHSFNSSTSGSNPQGSLVQGADNNFYGLTQNGGTSGYGTIFKITASGTLTVLRSLAYATDGGNPTGDLIQSGGNFYGMTYRGGTNSYGTIFRISPSGTFTVLKHLESATTGRNPSGSLVKGTDGNFYGTMSEGGANSYGTIFKMTPSGTFTVLRHLDSSNDGRYPYGNLIQGSNGNLYGLTNRGGLFGEGTIFKISIGGTFSVLHHLDYYNDGGRPQGSLVQGSDNSFYGVTPEGGFFSGGTIFKITASGTFSVLRQLDPVTDGSKPMGELVIRKANPVANAQSITTTEETGKAITLTGSASGTSLVYTIVTPPANGTLSGSGATRTYKPKANFSGKDSFKFKVVWGCQESVVKTVSITVTNVNDAPVLATIGDKNATTGSPLKFTATATDPDAGQSKIFSLIGAPAGATINANSGAFAWTPATDGSYLFKVRVADNGTPPLFDEEVITVTVSAGIVQFNRSVPTTSNSEITKLIRLYPNPVTDRFTVNLPEPVTQISTSIVNTAGAEVMLNGHQQTSPDQIQVNVGQLKAGMYLFHLQLDQKRQVLKFIKR